MAKPALERAPVLFRYLRQAGAWLGAPTKLRAFNEPIFRFFYCCAIALTQAFLTQSGKWLPFASRAGSDCSATSVVKLAGCTPGGYGHARRDTARPSVQLVLFHL